MTTDIEQIQQEIAKAQATLTDLQNKLKQEKNKKWEPKKGQFCITGCGDIVQINGLLEPEKYLEYGNMFETRGAATKASIAYCRYHRLYKLAEELNEGWEPDWSYNSPKFYIYKQHPSGSIKVSSVSVCEDFGKIYFKSREVAERVIEIIKNGGLDG